MRASHGQVPCGLSAAAIALMAAAATAAAAAALAICLSVLHLKQAIQIMLEQSAESMAASCTPCSCCCFRVGVCFILSNSVQVKALRGAAECNWCHWRMFRSPFGVSPFVLYDGCFEACVIGGPLLPKNPMVCAGHA
ncbi:hypothetical protein COO60DRAFT_1508892 [Scenedesmus sp. NREL 46B-D3]|nr:hypothetical protein COO60DRAFT_1508892 [Scenedesmus sp. NREL 46B-D3]